MFDWLLNAVGIEALKWARPVSLPTLLGVVVLWAGGFLRGTLFGLKWQDLTGNAGQPKDKSVDYSNK